ncbi:MAG: AAA family ATPase [Clostridia bacterium]|nr:AAA family ATPase [Clostridia bacterium]
MKTDVVAIENIPSMNVEEAVNTISDAYSSIIEKSMAVNAIFPFMLWGPPGVGKSQLVRQVAKVIENGTGKRVIITDVRLLLFNPIDLRGIPTANEDKTLAVWLKPKIFQMDKSDDVINILFLDELSACSASVQAAAYQITLDRVIGEHKLADNCIVITAGNRVTDKSVAFKMPKALANRLTHIEIESGFEGWKKWAKKNRIHYNVVDFLNNRREYLMKFDPQNDDLAYPTPRSWENVSNALNVFDGDIEKAYTIISGSIGAAAALEFKMWCTVYNRLPDVEEIFRGKRPDAPKGSDALFALISNMVAYAREHRYDFDLIGNAIDYSQLLLPDFSVSFIKELLNLESGYNKKLISLPAYRRWIDKRGVLLNGID